MADAPENPDQPEIPQTPVAIVARLTPRQRRLRVATILILAVIAVMIVVGVTQPFFHPHPHGLLTPLRRKALAVQALIIMSYWTVAMLLACALFLLAWLDIREVRLKTALARRDMWRDVAARKPDGEANRGGNGAAHE